MQVNKTTIFNSRANQAANFKGIGTTLAQGATKFFQVCDDVPMFGVAVTDTVATNVPRTVMDTVQTGVPAGAETARREFSGLFVNCLIPGGFVFGAAKIMNDSYMRDFKTRGGNVINLSRSWANEEAVTNLINTWIDYAALNKDISTIEDPEEAKNALKLLAERKPKRKEYVKNVLKNVEALNGTDNWVAVKDKGALLDEATDLIEKAMDTQNTKGFFNNIKSNRKKNKYLKQAYDTIVTGKYEYVDNFGNKIVKIIDKTGGLEAAQNIKYNGKMASGDLKNFLRDTVDVVNAFTKSDFAMQNPRYFLKRATGLINAKSLSGLAVVIPLAVSMQTINRAITRWKYNKSGAPIYKDFEKEERTLTEKEKKQLAIGKPLAVASMIGLSALSMGKTLPKSGADFVKMLQFNTKFPTLNQCRVIATSTFASRMMASEDPNELRGHTIRDLASFTGLYFLGDYAEKLTAEAIQKFSKPGRTGELQMFNRTRQPDYKNNFERFAGWIKDKKVKSFDEIPQKFKNYRTLAKVGSLGFSILLLGVLLPMYNNLSTARREKKRKAMLEKQRQFNNIYDPKSVFPSSDIGKTKSSYPKWNPYLKNKAFTKVASQFMK